MKHIVIIGNGISGITAARHIRKLSDNRITVISGETEYFFSRTALMYIYMGHMTFEHTKPYEDWFWKKNRIELVFDYVSNVDTATKSLTLTKGQPIRYDVLIIATGSKPNTFGWPGQHLQGVQGLYSYQDLALLEQNTKGIKHGVIVGGGLIGIELAEMLRSRNIDVTFLVREKSFWSNVLPLQESELITKHIQSHNIKLKLNTELKSIEGRDERVNGIVTTQGETIACDFVGITVGVSPNIEFLKTSNINVNRGVIVNELLQTNVDDVYAIGDCVERDYDLPGRKRIEQVWYTGRMMGEAVAKTICEKPTPYNPGPWFNSAKFFDIEYQTYGTVTATRSEDEQDFYWEHPSGNTCVHLVWHRDTHTFIGINTFGIRMRHEVFDQWLRDAKTIQFVMENLQLANFDPEFFTRHEPEIISQFNQQFPVMAVAQQKKTFLQKLFQ